MMRTESSVPFETAQGLLLHSLTSLFHTLASFKMAMRLCNIIYRLKETEKHSMTPLSFRATLIYVPAPAKVNHQPPLFP